MTDVKRRKTLVSNHKLKQLEGLICQMTGLLHDVKTNNSYSYDNNYISAPKNKQDTALGYNIKTLKSMLDKFIVEGIFRDYAPLLNSTDPIRVSNKQISKGSINMNLVSGLWYRHSKNIGAGKDIINFIEYASGISNKEAIKIFADRVKAKQLRQFNSLVRGDFFQGKAVLKDTSPIGESHSRQPYFTPKKYNKNPWIPYDEVPFDAPEFDLDKDLNFYLEQGNFVTNVYEYRSCEGNLLGYTIRALETKVSSKAGATRQVKQVRPVSYCKHENGIYKGWQLRGFLSNGYKPIYRAEYLGYYDCTLKGLRKDPSKPVLIVEGEKTADAAAELFPDFCVISWLGGTSSADKVNWNLLKFRQVVIWPDNDEPGKNAALKIENQLIEISGKKLVHVFDIEQLNLPEAWDLADDLPDHLTLDQIKSTLNNLLNLPCTVNEGIK